MSEARGFSRFLAVKSQTAWGSKATGLTSTVVPIREGALFSPNPYLVPRDDVVNAVSPYGMHYASPKLVPFQLSVVLCNATSGNGVIRDLLRSIHGKEVTATGPPITSTFSIFDALIDGGIDGTPANNVYNRALTLHEQCNDDAGTLIYSDEIQDCVIEELNFMFEPDKPITVRMRGMGSLFTPNAASVTASNPDGSPFTFRHMKDTSNSGLRIGTANPPVTNDNVIFQRGALNFRNTLRYEPFLGIGALVEARKAMRNDSMMIDMDVEGDVENDITNQYDSKNATDDWNTGADVNVRLLAQIDASNILEFQCSATKAGVVNRGAFIENIQKSAPNKGAMHFNMKVRMAPTTPSTDLYTKLTRAS